MFDIVILFSIGLILSIISLVVGSMTPIYLSLMQFFFPTLTLGNIIGADKINGVFRGVGALPSFWDQIDWKFILKTIPAFLIGSIIGANIVSEISMIWILPLLIMAFCIAEFAPFFSKFFTKKSFFAFEGILGIYAGLIGASIKPTLLGIFRVKIPDDKKIIFLKIQIQTIMFFVVIGAGIAHYFHGNLIWEIILPLGIGNTLGGFIGGKILKRTGKLSGKIQKNIMRASFTLGILVSGWMVLVK